MIIKDIYFGLINFLYTNFLYSKDYIKINFVVSNKIICFLINYLYL